MIPAIDDIEAARVEVFVRSLAPAGAVGRQNAIVERLLKLKRSGIVADVDVTVWGDGIALGGPNARIGASRRIVDTISEFRRWCDEHDASIDQFFERTTVDSSITGESYIRLVLPSICLAVYDDRDDLRSVFPSAAGDTTYSVEDGLRRLEQRGSSSDERTVTHGSVH